MSGLSGVQRFRFPIAPIWQWCRDRIDQDSRSNLQYCPSEDVERIANDLRMPAAELLSVARRSPDAADLLRRRMTTLDLDETEISRTEPGALRDMQRCCTLCASRRRCARDLSHDPADPKWKEYCPNATTLTALDAMPWASRREW